MGLSEIEPMHYAPLGQGRGKLHSVRDTQRFNLRYRGLAEIAFNVYQLSPNLASLYLNNHLTL